VLRAAYSSRIVGSERPRAPAGYPPGAGQPQTLPVEYFASEETSVERRRLAMKVRPLHDRLIVRRIEEKETVKGGIIIPDTAKEKPQEGEVIAVGNGKILENGTKLALDVKAGDKILFGKYSGTDIKIDGEEYLILREDEVLAIVG
jgi:chaperonin GroES